MQEHLTGVGDAVEHWLASIRTVDDSAAVAGMMMASFGEGLKLAEEVGVDQGTLLEAIGISAIAAPMYKLKARPRHRTPSALNGPRSPVIDEFAVHAGENMSVTPSRCFCKTAPQERRS
jgi:hypothetical protein